MKAVDCMSVLKALGEMNRLRIMRLLMSRELDVNTIAGRLELTEYNVSKHLRILKEAGLLEMHKDGKQRLYGESACIFHNDIPSLLLDQKFFHRTNHPFQACKFCN